MTPTPRFLGMLAAAGLLAAVATGCSNGTSSAGRAADKETTQSAPTTTTPPPAPPPAPKTGECRNLGYPEISRYTNSTKAIPCGQGHTAYTYAVPDLPDDVAFDGVSIQNDAVQQAAADACHASFNDYVGGDAARRALARLTPTYFLPSQDDFARGAHWVRCDVIALQSRKVLAELPRKTRGVLNDDAILDDYGVCSRGEPGTAGFKPVMCTRPHTFRALEALRLGERNDAYPGADVAKSDGKKRCAAVVKARRGQGVGYTFSWTYPSSADWQNGQRFGYCWLKTDT